jgi:hypothetical protein
MPCVDYEYPEPTQHIQAPTTEEQLAAKMPAVLCNLVNYLGVEIVMKSVDWEQAGVDADDFAKWWSLHSKRDLEKNTKGSGPSALTADNWRYRVVIYGYRNQYAMTVSEAWKLIATRDNHAATWNVYDNKGNLCEEFIVS